MNKQVILSASKDKLAAALEILFASVEAYVPFDPARRYTPKEREPYDALTDRDRHTAWTPKEKKAMIPPFFRHRQVFSFLYISG